MATDSNVTPVLDSNARRVRHVALSAMTGALALAVSVLVMAERPAERHQMAQAAPAAVASYDTSVPAARADNDALPEEQAATF
jgi:hypothetical protein